MSTVAKVLMSSGPSERAWYEDQITVNLWARRLMIGNSRVIIVDAGDAGSDAFPVSDLKPGALDNIRQICETRGWRLIEGSVLFTGRDNPRKYPTSDKAVAARAATARKAAGWAE